MVLSAALLAAMVPGVAAEPVRQYRAGQVWEYRTRPVDAGSLVKIQKVERDPAFAKYGPIYHITVIGVHVFGQAVATPIEHMPVSRATLDASLTREVTSDAAFPDVEAGIAQWRHERGGVFTSPLDEAIAGFDHISIAEPAPPPTS
jgi:hypothetical protein